MKKEPKEEIVDRKSLMHIDSYREIFEAEYHHNHPIIKDEEGTIRWKADKEIENLTNILNLNYLCSLLYLLGYDKNSEIYRKMYRGMGYSLSGYYEIFFWLNNEKCDEYRPTTDCKIFSDKELTKMFQKKIKSAKNEHRQHSLEGKLDILTAISVIKDIYKK